MAKLVCVAGMNKGDEFPISEGVTVIGREKSCDILLFDKKCSRRHCQVYKKGRHYAIEDLGSRSGTLVNRKAIAKKRSIKPGDRIHLGSTTLLLTEKPLGDLIDQTATEVAAELSERRFEKVFDNVAAQAVKASKEEKRQQQENRGFFAPLRNMFFRK